MTTTQHTGRQGEEAAARCRALIRAANAYLTENTFEGEMQFDLIAVETAPAGTPEVRYIEDAIELHW